MDVSGYDFLDFGCSSGGAIQIALKRLGGVNGLGIDIDPAKVKKAREAGYNAEVADVTKLDLPDGAVRFVVLSHFLEHLHGKATVYGALEQALRVSSDFVFIQGPYFDADRMLQPLGFKFFWSDWHGHPYHLTVEELLLWAEAEPRIVRRHVSLAFPVRDSSDRSIHPAESPRDQVHYDPATHPPKATVAFDRPVYGEFAAVLARRELPNWASLTKARPVAFACSTAAEFLGHTRYGAPPAA